MTQPARECRICFSSDAADSKLISPCHCRGTSAFIHRHCLKTWIDSSRRQTCGTCKTIFYSKLSRKKFSTWNLTSEQRWKLAVSIVSLAAFFLLTAAHYPLCGLDNADSNRCFYLFLGQIFTGYIFIEWTYRLAKEMFEENKEIVYADHPVHIV